ncbi:MAG TPA: MarC family protein [Nitrospirae bacterium]|nr:MarC family protein [Nitrospirota bacterium]
MMTSVLTFVRNLPNTFIPIFVAVDIFALLPLFMAYTAGLPQKKTERVIRLSILTALLVSSGFLAVGEAIFTLLGITVDDFKIAGGLLLLVIAILEVVRSEERRGRVTDEGVGVVPIGVPLIVGPAVLTTLLVLMEHYGVGLTVTALLLNLLVVWIFFKNSALITRRLGKNGMMALSKLMAILLASIAVMMIRIGIENTVRLR